MNITIFSYLYFKKFQHKFSVKNSIEIRRMHFHYYSTTRSVHYSAGVKMRILSALNRILFYINGDDYNLVGIFSFNGNYIAYVYELWIKLNFMETIFDVLKLYFFLFKFLSQKYSTIFAYGSTVIAAYNTRFHSNVYVIQKHITSSNIWQCVL